MADTPTVELPLIYPSNFYPTPLPISTQLYLIKLFQIQLLVL